MLPPLPTAGDSKLLNAADPFKKIPSRAVMVMLPAFPRPLVLVDSSALVRDSVPVFILMLPASPCRPRLLVDS